MSFFFFLEIWDWSIGVLDWCLGTAYVQKFLIPLVYRFDLEVKNSPQTAKGCLYNGLQSNCQFKDST
jgi:hypothetical protein